MKSQNLVAAIALACLMGLTACTAPSGPETKSPAPETSSSQSPGQPEATTAAGDSIFSPLTSAASYWSQHPEGRPEAASMSRPLLDQSGTGPQKFAVPNAAKHSALLLVLVCDKKVPYRVTPGNATNPELPKTWGNSCGGDMINSYQTPPYDPKNPAELPEFVSVTVPEGVNYYLTVYGTDGTKAG